MKKEKFQPDRRRALRGIASTPAIAAVAVAGQAQAAPVVAETPAAPTKGKGKGYQETQHVRDYYRTAAL
ncbi:MAG: formate dehydrogenase [Burkholderiaceae bacterium]